MNGRHDPGLTGCFVGLILMGERNRLTYHLDPDWRKWHSPQHITAMDASFLFDRWLFEGARLLGGRVHDPRGVIS
jgi:hypothetical protein